MGIVRNVVENARATPNTLRIKHALRRGVVLALAALTSCSMEQSIQSETVKDFAGHTATLQACVVTAHQTPGLLLRLTNCGNLPFVVDRELVFMFDVTAIGAGNEELSFDEIASMPKPENRVVRQRLVSLGSGECVERVIDLAKPSKAFITGMGSSLGGQLMKVSAYEAMCRTPKGICRLDVAYNPGYGSGDGFTAYVGDTPGGLGMFTARLKVSVTLIPQVQQRLDRALQ